MFLCCHLVDVSESILASLNNKIQHVEINDAKMHSICQCSNANTSYKIQLFVFSTHILNACFINTAVSLKTESSTDLTAKNKVSCSSVKSKTFTFINQEGIDGPTPAGSWTGPRGFWKFLHACSQRCN